MLLHIVYAILFVDTADMKIKACNALNVMLVETVDTTVKTHPHIPAHKFPNIQPIQVMAFYTKYNTFNAMHVNTVDTVEKP